MASLYPLSHALATEGMKLPRPVIVEALERARTARAYVYPWPALEGDLVGAERDHLRLIGYGSLVHAGSARRTLSSEHRMPVVVAGAQRLFNYVMDPIPDRYGPPERPAARAALNVRVTYRADDLLNGVLTHVPIAEIPALRAREPGYDLVPVPFALWSAPTSVPEVAYLLEAPDGVARDGRVRTRADLEPHPAYYAVCREGAASFGQPFLAFWLDTTFLANGVTTARDWERRAVAEARGGP
jgi:hypothetical protein